jgi:lipopolysaccharide/colanic/teichoic acid biosynthesis glycosyltransferase
VKRAFDITFSTLGLVVFSPAFGVLAVAIKLSDGGPVFFRQERVGQRGRLFKIIKFRSMVVNADRLGLSVTRCEDPRITRIGRFLRKTKLDELPQLWNVFKGEMSFVGPRPEVARYVERYNEEQRKVLSLKPGITDPAALAFRNEEELLQRAQDIERFYVEECMPRKIALSLEYAQRASVWTDVAVIVRTMVGDEGGPACLAVAKRRQVVQLSQTADTKRI